MALTQANKPLLMVYDLAKHEYYHGDINKGCLQQIGKLNWVRRQ